jgi:hypothetical protein
VLLVVAGALCGLLIAHLLMCWGGLTVSRRKLEVSEILEAKKPHEDRGDRMSTVLIWFMYGLPILVLVMIALLALGWRP